MGKAARMALIGLAAGSLALLAASCGGDEENGVNLSAVEPVDTETCGEVEYKGSEEPQVLIVSDLPLKGDSAARSEQQNEAIRLSLENAGWAAGRLQVGFQACDDSIEETGLWDEETCKENADEYAGDDSVLGVIGTYNSGCAAIEIPILNHADVAMVSPGNTAVCLTRPSPSCQQGQPNSLYPDHLRNYARVVPNDAAQAAGLVAFAKDRGIERPFVLYAADDPTSAGQAANFKGAADSAGLELAGYGTWDPEANGYADLFAKVRSSGADAVVLAGLTEQNGGVLIRDKVAALGPNDGPVPLIAFDGFAQQSTIEEAGDAAAGMYASVPGRAPENLEGAGKAFADELSGRVDGTLELYAPYAGEAAAVLLDAIARGGDNRPEVVSALFNTTRTDGILGSYEIEPSGDPSAAQVTVFVADGSFEVDTEVTPPPGLIGAARGER